MPSALGRKILGGFRNHFWMMALIVVALDQLTKQVFSPIGGEPYRTVLVPGFLNFVGRPPNPHGAFSLGPSNALFYVAVTLGGLGLITWLLLTTPRERRLPHMALGCVAGGAIGNLIDRLALGAVRDFIDAHWLDKAHWPSFNVADSALCVGVGLLLLEAFRHPSEKEPPKPRKTAKADTA